MFGPADARRASRFARWAAAGLAALPPACAPQSGPTDYSLAECRRVEIVAASGDSIFGVEDLAFDGARLILSAYDRSAVERAAANSLRPPPEGGVYAVPIAAFDGGEDAPIIAQALIGAGAIEGGVRPHGIALGEGGAIAFINRAYVRDQTRWRMAPQRIEASAAGAIEKVSSVHCAANDLTAGDPALVSIDHRACGIRAALEDLTGARGGGIVGATGERLFSGARFANGVASLPAEAFALGATRENAVIILERSGGELRPSRRIRTPGGPDNLSVAEDGDIIAAVHPSLIRFAFARKLGWGRAPSRIIRIQPDAGAVETLVDDRQGRLFSGATAAVEIPGGLVAGSAIDSGLLYCARDP